MLNRIKIDSETFYSILDRFPKYIDYEDDISKYFARGYPNKKRIKVDKQSRTLIVQAYRLNSEQILGEKDWQLLICKIDESLDSPEQIRVVPWANQVNKKIKEILLSKYSQDEVNNIFNNHSLENGKKQLHMLVPSAYREDGKIHRFEGCVYYDINKAYTEALLEMFPKCKNQLIKLSKDWLNIYIGDLVNNGYRTTYNWIVDRIRNKIEDIINKTGGITIYANTDGVIIYHPKNHLPTSKEIGDIKSQSSDGVVYTYFCKSDANTTPYTIYQYNDPEKGKQLKGNARLKLRKYMDLSKGIVVKAKLWKDKYHFEHFKNVRVEEIEIENEEKEV